MEISSGFTPHYLSTYIQVVAACVFVCVLSSGYTRDTSFLEMVVDIVQELKRANPNLVYGE